MYRFGEMTFDPARRELRRGNTLVHLEPMAFDLLAYLIDHRDRVVPKIELLDGVWGHTFASEANLTTRVKEVRRAVGDDGRCQHTIRNIRGRGYRFVADIGPVRAAQERPGPSPLVGRDAALADLVKVLGAAPLTTLVGPGGVGKSTLARAVASVAAPGRDEGCRVVELAPVDPHTAVLPVVASALGLVLDQHHPENALASLARRDALLVLDNCEHVVDEAAEFIDALLGIADRRVSVLATSQLRLGLSLETVVPVEPLANSDAVALFHDRARAATSDWDPDDIDPVRVQRLVERLDRLPLTVEMASARLGSMTFAELERAITELSPLVHMTHQARVPRHRSLPTIVDWSASLLHPEHRRVFCGFSVFSGAVTAGNAAAVLAPGAESAIMFDLAALAERSLLVAERSDGETRYRMLGTVRAVAARWLDEAGTSEKLRARHASHLRNVLDEIDAAVRTPDEAAARGRLASIRAEIRAAHAWAREHDVEAASAMSGALFYAAYSALWSEPVEWSRALFLDGTVDAVRLPGAALVVAGAAAHRGELRFAREVGLAVAELSKGSLRVGAIELLADIALYEGDLETAAAWGGELSRLGGELGDRHAEALGIVDQALALAYGGQPLSALEQLLDERIEQLAPSDAAWLAYARGDAVSLAGDLDAGTAFAEAIELGNRVGNRYVVSVSYTSLAAEVARQGDAATALDTYAAAFDEYLRHGNYTHAVTAIRNLIPLLASLHDDEGAALLAGATSRVRESFGAEAHQLSGVLDTVADHIGQKRFAAWLAMGRSLELDMAVRTATDLVHRHRATAS